VLLWAGKVASDVELAAFLFFGLVIKMAGRLLRTPYQCRQQSSAS
jgi:hypothetical protein